MGQAWSVDLGHWMADGDIIRSGPVARRALFMATIVECATSLDVGVPLPVPPACLGRIGRARCTGLVDAMVEPDAQVVSWSCRACGSRGVTTGWEGTRFDLRGACEDQFEGGVHAWVSLHEWTLLHSLRPPSPRARAVLAQALPGELGLLLEMTPGAHAHVLAQLREAVAELSPRGRKRFAAALHALATPEVPGGGAASIH